MGKKGQNALEAIQAELSGEYLREHLGKDGDFGPRDLTDMLGTLFHNVCVGSLSELSALVELNLLERLWPDEKEVWTPGPGFSSYFDPDGAEWTLARAAQEAAAAWHLVETLESRLGFIETLLEEYEKQSSK